MAGEDGVMMPGRAEVFRILHGEAGPVVPDEPGRLAVELYQNCTKTILTDIKKAPQNNL